MTIVCLFCAAKVVVFPSIFSLLGAMSFRLFYPHRLLFAGSMQKKRKCLHAQIKMIRFTPMKQHKS